MFVNVSFFKTAGHLREGANAIVGGFEVTPVKKEKGARLRSQVID
jgi:hypothetical protein